MPRREDGSRDSSQLNQDAHLLRDGLVWLLQRRDWGGKRWRLERLLERLERLPAPTGLLNELEQTVPAAPPARASSAGVRSAAGNALAATEFATKTVELLRALAGSMADAALFDSQLQNSIRVFGESVPSRMITADLRRLLADTRAVDAAARRARRAEFQRRQEVGKIVNALARAVEESTARSDSITRGLEDVLQQLWAQPDVDGMRSLRQQVTSRVQTLTEQSRSLREDLQGAKSRSSTLESLVAEQAERIVDLQAKTSQDPLTQVANRRAYDRLLPQLVQTCKSTDTPFALVILDLDHFKRINDGHGHPMGDRVLQEVARAIARGLRQDDLLARIGGEEFAVLIKGAVPNVARVVAERLRRGVAALELYDDDETKVPVTVSLGLANLRPDDDHESLYARADRAMYQAKRGGRDRLVDDWLDEGDDDH
jgi:diguanylate cyclase (GGDEF)-like protein